MSATPDSKLANPERRIADLEREITNLQQRLDEAQARETATAEVLPVINSSPGDLAPVFDAMLEKALRLCGAAFGQLHTFDGERFQLLAVRGLTSAAAERIRRLAPDPGGALARVFGGERVVHIPGLIDTDAYRSPASHRAAGSSRRPGLAPRCGRPCARTTPYSPLSSSIGKRRGHSLTRKSRCSRASPSKRSSRWRIRGLLGDLRERTGDLQEALEQQTAKAEVLGVINSSPGDLAPVFDAILRSADSAGGNG
jgi:hypothetical protein